MTKAKVSAVKSYITTVNLKSNLNVPVSGFRYRKMRARARRFKTMLHLRKLRKQRRQSKSTAINTQFSN